MKVPRVRGRRRGSSSRRPCRGPKDPPPSALCQAQKPRYRYGASGRSGGEKGRFHPHLSPLGRPDPAEDYKKQIKQHGESFRHYRGSGSVVRVYKRAWPAATHRSRVSWATVTGASSRLPERQKRLSQGWSGKSTLCVAVPLWFQNDPGDIQATHNTHELPQTIDRPPPLCNEARTMSTNAVEAVHIFRGTSLLGRQPFHCTEVQDGLAIGRSCVVGNHDQRAAFCEIPCVHLSPCGSGGKDDEYVLLIAVSFLTQFSESPYAVQQKRWKGSCNEFRSGVAGAMDTDVRRMKLRIERKPTNTQIFHSSLDSRHEIHLWRGNFYYNTMFKSALGRVTRHLVTLLTKLNTDFVCVTIVLWQAALRPELASSQVI